MGGNARAWILSSVLLGALLTSAASRPWKSNQAALARDYATILDQRGKADFVMLMWLVPEQIEEDQRVLREVLSKYLLIGAVHARMDVTGTFSFDNFDSLPATDGKGRQLPALDNASLPPTLAGSVVTLQSVMSQGLGPMGKGIRWFVYRADGVGSCQPGGLKIQFAGETYTYETPIPGCPK